MRWISSALESHLSRGGTLDGELPAPRGHALQVCLSALDPEAGFVPRPGVVEALRLPAGPGLRADAAVDEGEVPATGEEIARVTAHGRTRAEALARLQRGLARTEASLRDGATDKAFLTEVLDRPELTARGPVDPGWLDALVASGEHLPRRGAEAALLGAAIAGYEADLDLARARFYASAARGRPEVPKEIGRAVELRYRGQEYLFRVSRLDRAALPRRGATASAWRCWPTARGGPAAPSPAASGAGGSPSPRRGTGSSWRWTASPTGSSARAARSCALRARRWSSRSPSARGTRWPPAIPWRCSRP